MQVPLSNKRLCPSIFDPVYLVFKPLSKQLLAEAMKFKQEARCNQIVIDIGCGDKPYLEWFAPITTAYWGIDIDNPNSDVCGECQELPFKDAVADIVLCIQVLEHCEDPQKVLSEIRRILKPNGIVMLSTHGVYIYHPAPGDYCRWTHEGLRAAFKRAGLEVMRILPNGGVIACLFFLGITLLVMFSYLRRWLAWMRWFFAPFFNFLGEKLDNFFNNHLYPRSKYLLVANYLAIARKPL